MCRNITELRGLEPAATTEEIEAAARQYIRKVTGIAKPKAELAARLEDAAMEVADVTARMSSEISDRRQPPNSVPPLRRPEVRARLGLAPVPV